MQWGTFRRKVTSLAQRTALGRQPPGWVRMKQRRILLCLALFAGMLLLAACSAEAEQVIKTVIVTHEVIVEGETVVEEVVEPATEEPVGEPEIPPSPPPHTPTSLPPTSAPQASKPDRSFAERQRVCQTAFSISSFRP